MANIIYQTKANSHGIRICKHRFPFKLTAELLKLVAFIVLLLWGGMHLPFLPMTPEMIAQKYGPSSGKGKHSITKNILLSLLAIRVAKFWQYFIRMFCRQRS